jgi:hypothetical protein
MRHERPRPRGGGWYVQPALRGNYTLGLLLVALTLSACGGGNGSSDANEPAGTYRAEVVTAEFPTSQGLGQTSLMKLGVHNTGDRTIPAVIVTITVAGREGRTSALPFGFRDPQPDLAQPDRPVWVLAAGYPKRAGDATPGGAGTSSQKTFNLGPLEPGKTTEWVWKVSAVEAGRYTVLYKVDAGLGGTAKAETAGGVQPGGSFAVRISKAPPNTIVTDSGEVVTIPKGEGQGN